MRLRHLITTLAAAALMVTGITTASAQTEHRPKPTIVLLHGAFADAASWSGVTERLQRDGYTVVAPAVPLRGVATDTAYLKGVLDGIQGPKVLVGHSYGGALVSELAGTSGVKSLVYVAAFIPQAGETIGALNSKFPGSELGPDTTNAISYPGGVDLVVKPEAFHRVFAADLPARQAAVLGASQRPVAAAVFDETILATAPAALPKYALVPTGDHAIAPAAELFMAQRAHATTVEVPGASHLVALSHPSTVTRLIEQAAR
ncbi:alpha/beta hydrolase [Kribbella jejuensis]|uniref:Pimeloyl-ACP methyl ester carboxylesterase n=1 Tax=Kribbella jejuensis TaxID=236068 RepID=A0A542EP08_9ACTN|nr:alpha/beta hydrolase [Kribbella jejuensis]TQJ17090.1 pimeloyl-ACP methyl ester carboxylesterase [Kribbella jejuensis]